MYYQQLQENELGFDAFIAPGGFDRTAQPVDIYEKFKYWYPIDNKAKYIYYYSDGNYPLTLTPTTDEYYKYGYTRWNAATSQYIDVTEDMPLNSAARTIWGSAATFGDESGYTKRWVCVYRVGTDSFLLAFNQNTRYALWVYCGNKINGIRSDMSYSIGTIELKYVHFANINSITYNFHLAFYDQSARKLTGTITFPESMTSIGSFAFWDAFQSLTKLNMPSTKNLQLVFGGFGTFKYSVFQEFNAGATCPVGDFNEFTNTSRTSVSEQNTLYSSLNNCDIIFNKAQDTIVWLAPKTVRGICLPDTLPQTQVDALGTKLSANLMANHQLYIGTLITNITNLYLLNKKFVTVDCSVDNPNYLSESNILYNKTKTQLVKCGTSNTGNLVIQNTVVGIDSGAFNGCSGYTELTFTAPFDTAIYSDWNFATFTGESIYNAIQMLVDGTAGNVKTFIINQATMDNLLAYNSDAVVAAGLRFINVTVFTKGNKLSLDAGNTASYPGTGTVWNDLSGSNNGTLVNGVAFSMANGGVMSFDGRDDYVNLPSINMQSELTISAWIRPSSVSISQVFVSKWKSGAETDNSYLMFMGEGNNNCVNFLLYQSNNSTRVIVATDLPLIAGSIYNVVCTAKAGVMSIYINGVKSIKTQTYDGTIKQTTRNTLLGKLRQEDSIYSSNATMNNIDIYDYALTPEKVNVNFQALRTKYGI